MDRRGRGSFFILLQLLNHLMYLGGFSVIPPVTLFVTLVNVAVHFENFFMPVSIFPSVETACISVFHVWTHLQWKRLIYGAFFHLDDLHLYYNMVSFLSKGIRLEKRLSSQHFGFLLVFCTVASGVVLIALNILMMILTNDTSYELTCAVGFSAVIFAIKVVLNYMNPQEQHAYGGFLIPYKYIHWLEVVMIQLIVPQASFLGHISGIIVGLIYCKTPLKDIFSRIFPPDQRSESEHENPYSSNRYNQYPGHQPHYDAYQSPYTPYGFRYRRF
ncbi:rhomboid-related protein 4 [Octopus sinensis]|uniref:Rhomboid-related protein 4 n=1 Tax=Octopus sinensis TaxID=2607531 RepID=A0A6P7UAN1_9MOLL|nr:rhomboid-related protein 4 [Octopus sinensis]XP_036370882.1 rhomboid-related protein 4 [Octopus sinensis]